MKARVAMIGMAVMGRHLALNMLDHGMSVIGHDRDAQRMRSAATGCSKLTCAADLSELVAALERPRRIMLMIEAGAPVDEVLGRLTPLLSEGDIVIDGGNAWYRDTERRAKQLAADGVPLLGVGISGGPEGARHGASLMVGGAADAYAAVAPMLEAVAAESSHGRCLSLMGPGGAGHFVKMVHNGIEYAAMQMIAEVYDMLARVLRLDPPAIAEAFAGFNRGRLASYLIELTAGIFRQPNDRGDGWLVDQVLDHAEQKGTGRWTARAALDLGVAAPSIMQAVTARVLSSMKSERLAAAARLEGPAGSAHLDPESFVKTLAGALEAGLLTTYAQGMALIAAAAMAHGWPLQLAEVARIWTGGSILRAHLLEDVVAAFTRAPDLPNAMLDETIRSRLCDTQGKLRQAVQQAQRHGIPAPVLGASLAYYDSYRAEQLPQNLTQAQRDAFGAHGYRRKDDPEGAPLYGDWLD